MEKIKATASAAADKLSEAAKAAKEKVEEKFPGIGDQTNKLGEDMNKEASLIYKNTLKSSVDSVKKSVS